MKEQHPAPLGGILVDLRPPEKLDDPRNAEKRSQTDRLEADLHVTEENRRDNSNDGVRKAFREIGCEGPYVRGLKKGFCPGFQGIFAPKP